MRQDPGFGGRWRLRLPRHRLSQEMDSTDAKTDNRDLPFTLRVAADWKRLEELPTIGDNALFFRRRESLTNISMVTAAGQDIQFSDINLS
jgi:hypothetical protein